MIKLEGNCHVGNATENWNSQYICNQQYQFVAETIYLKLFSVKYSKK